MRSEAGGLEVRPLVLPPLDAGFVPAVLWNRAYRERVAGDAGRERLVVAIQRPDGICFVEEAEILSDVGVDAGLNRFYIERLLKFWLWQKGGSRVWIAGSDELAKGLGAMYRPGGERGFDAELVGAKMFLEPMKVSGCVAAAMPPRHEPSASPGRNLDGCRIGFDLGGSDRKCAALIDGEVVFSEEVPWNPYFESDPQYHVDGIQDSLRRAAAHLPRVDAIGGSAAGVYVHNEVRAASLFRGVPAEAFEHRVRRIFLDLKAAWDDIPFEVVNDGDVTALAGSMSLNDGALLGIAMGTSLAAGYCDPNGRLTSWLNELAFAPVDYRVSAPVDEWSGDRGCGVQYFSQQAVARLAAAAGMGFPADMPFADQLVEVQRRMADGDPAAEAIYRTIGVYFGYAIAHYAEFYTLRHVMLLGRVSSGPGGTLIVQGAERVLKTEFPVLYEQIRITMPNEKMKRHGQAVAAASLPALKRER